MAAVLLQSCGAANSSESGAGESESAAGKGLIRGTLPPPRRFVFSVIPLLPPPQDPPWDASQGAQPLSVLCALF